MTVEQIVDKFKKYPKALTNGAGHLSKRWNCSKNDIYKARAIVRGGETTKAKILIFDIETSPTISYTWRRFKENISLDQVEQDPIMLTWSAKWLYSADVMSDAITTKEIRDFDDKRIVTSLWELMDEADIVVAHYGDMFDVPMLNSRAIINELPPYNVVRSIDTKKVCSRQFRFPSNKLDAIASYFNLGSKIKTDFNLWKRCIQADPTAIKEMETYNIQDVVLLEEVYLKLRPWIKSHPNLGLYIESDNERCSNCGSEDVKETGSYYYTNVSKFKTYRCKCGAITRGRKNMYSKDKRKNLTVSVTR